MVKKTSGEDSICPLYSWTKHGWAKKHLTRNIFCQNRFGQEFWLPIYGLVKTRLVEIFGWPYTAWSKRVWSEYYLCQICLVQILSMPNMFGANCFFAKCYQGQVLSEQLCTVHRVFQPDTIFANYLQTDNLRTGCDNPQTLSMLS